MYPSSAATAATILPYDDSSLFMNELYQSDNVQDLVLDQNIKYEQEDLVFNTLQNRPGESFNISSPKIRYHHRNSVPIITTPVANSFPTPTTTGRQNLSRRRNTEGNLPKYKATAVPNSSEESSEEQKKKNVLERNRQAALKCRQRKKQWIADLQNRVEFLSTDNDQLAQQAEHLREEIINLKTLLLAHKDCKVAQMNQGMLSFQKIHYFNPNTGQSGLPSPPPNGGFNMNHHSVL